MKRAYPYPLIEGKGDREGDQRDEDEKKFVDFHRRGPELPAAIGTSGHADKPDEHDASTVEPAVLLRAPPGTEGVAVGLGDRGIRKACTEGRRLCAESADHLSDSAHTQAHAYGRRLCEQSELGWHQRTQRWHLW